MTTYEFYAHATPSLYGTGTEIEAAKLTQYMNTHRATNRRQVRAVANAGSPLLNIADEIKRHLAARGL